MKGYIAAIIICMYKLYKYNFYIHIIMAANLLVLTKHKLRVSKTQYILAIKLNISIGSDW